MVCRGTTSVSQQPHQASHHRLSLQLRGTNIPTLAFLGTDIYVLIHIHVHINKNKRTLKKEGNYKNKIEKKQKRVDEKNH